MAIGRQRRDLVLFVPHLGDGGTQRVVSILANAWSRRGLRVAILTLDRRPSVYALDPEIHWIPLERIDDRVDRVYRDLRSALPRDWPAFPMLRATAIWRRLPRIARRNVSRARLVLRLADRV